MYILIAIPVNGSCVVQSAWNTSRRWNMPYHGEDNQGIVPSKALGYTRSCVDPQCNNNIAYGQERHLHRRNTIAVRFWTNVVRLCCPFREHFWGGTQPSRHISVVEALWKDAVWSLATTDYYTRSDLSMLVSRAQKSGSLDSLKWKEVKRGFHMHETALGANRDSQTCRRVAKLRQFVCWLYACSTLSGILIFCTVRS